MSWDPTPAQRKLAFAGVVVALAAAGVYFTLPAFGGFGGRTATPASTEAAGGAGGAGARIATPRVDASPRPTASRTAAGIGDMLPLPEDELREAAETARRFTAAYATYRYDEGPQEYRGRLDPYVTDPIAEELAGGGGAAPAGRENLTREEVVVTAAASVEGTRLVSSDSVVVLVRADQTVESTKGTTSEDERFAVTVVDRDGGWKVSNVAPAGAGNAGDVS